MHKIVDTHQHRIGTSDKAQIMVDMRRVVQEGTVLLTIFK